jgi:hypothetical protein
MMRNNTRIFMFVCTMFLHEYMNSLKNGINNMSDNTHVRIKLYFEFYQGTFRVYSYSQWRTSYGSWIYNYLCNQCISPLKLWVLITFMRGVLDTTLRNKACQWLATCWRFSLGTPVSSTNKTYLHDVTGILLKVALNTITLSANTKRCML